MSQFVARLKDLGVILPRPAASVANYAPFVRTGSLLFVSGQLPLDAHGALAARYVGRLEDDLQAEIASQAARLCAINLLAQAMLALVDLDLVLRVVRLGGFFNARPAFTGMAKAMNGASDLMVAVFADQGRHARTTIGVAHLPLGAMAEVEAIFEVA